MVCFSSLLILWKYYKQRMIDLLEAWTKCLARAWEGHTDPAEGSQWDLTRVELVLKEKLASQRGRKGHYKE